MSSSTSPSPAPSDSADASEVQRGRLRERLGNGWRSWPVEILFPLLLALLMVSAIAPLLYMFLGEQFGLTAGRPTPWPWGFAFVGLVGCWGTRVLLQLRLPRGVLPVLSIALLALSLIAWFALQPKYDIGALLADPVSLVKENGYFVVPIFVAMAAWWQGARYAEDPGRYVPEEMRGVVQRCWLILTGSIVLAALVHNDAGAAAIDAAKVALPLCMIASVALVAGSEVESTRQLARRRGGQVPGWKRWYRLAGGFTVAIVVLTLIVLILLGPGTMRAILDSIVFGIRIVGWLLGYVLFALAYVLYLVVRALEAVFGDLFGPINPPKMENGAPPAQQQQIFEQGESQPWEHAVLLRWIAVGIALVIVGIIIFRVTRKTPPSDGDGIVEEERESVFSADLARKQLRDLFRRRHGPPAPERLDLDRAPLTVREAMIYLEVLAAREGVERRDAETPADFSRRLRGIWSGTGGALGDLIGSYHGVRYGDADDPENGPASRTAAEAWRQIWARRKPADDPGGHAHHRSP
ncbi:MAG: DUF4129 domain-containing protein [Thermomicrobiales bacterium]